MTREEALQILDTIPTIGEQVDALELAIEALSAEPCEDYVSRAELEKCFTVDMTDISIAECLALIVKRVRALPSAQPKPKTDTWSIKEVADALEKHGLRMSEISETEIKALTKEQNYFRGYKDGKSDVLDKIRAEIEFIPTIEWKDDGTTYILASYFKKQVLEIIDKYKAESEE